MENKTIRANKLGLLETPFFGFMIGAGETYIPAMALFFGFGELFSAKIAVLPLVFGALVALFFRYGPFQISNNRKGFVISASIIQSLSLFIIGYLIQGNQLSESLLLLFAFFYWACQLSIGPVWNAWINNLIGKSHCVHFFTNRGKLQEFSIMLGLIGAGLFLQHFPLKSSFATLFYISSLARLVSVFFISLQDTSIDHRLIKRTTENLKFDSYTKKKIIFLFGFYFAIHISSPFFTPYMIKELHFSYETYMIALSMPFISRVITYHIIEKKMKDIKYIFLFGVFGICTLPSLWAVSTNTFYVMALQTIAGIFWGAFDYGMLLILLEDHGDERRTRVFSWINMANSIGMLIGLYVGEILFSNLGFKQSSYAHLFILSSILRVICLTLLPKQLKAKAKGKLILRWVGVRAGTGGISKPFLWNKKLDGD